MKAKPEYKTKDGIQKAIDYGIDITLLYSALSKTPTERIECNLEMIKFAKELRKAGERKYIKS